MNTVNIHIYYWRQALWYDKNHVHSTRISTNLEVHAGLATLNDTTFHLKWFLLKFKWLWHMTERDVTRDIDDYLTYVYVRRQLFCYGS